MNARHRTALTIAASALLLGLAWDLLLRYVPWGVNALLWTVLFIGAAYACTTAARKAAGIAADPAPATAPKPLLFPAVAAVVAAAGIVWRDSGVLVALDVLLLAVFLPMLAHGARGVRPHSSGLGRIAAALAVTFVQSLAGTPRLLSRDVPWDRAPRVGLKGLGVAARGTLIALPALIIFGTLLAAADQEFARVMRELFVFDVESLFAHVFVTIVIAAAVAGFLHSLCFGAPMPDLSGSDELRLPGAEVNFALALVNLLFAIFVGVQFRYFFSARLTTDVLAQYARKGFFELVWVVALSMPMLMLLEWLVRGERGTRLFRSLAAIQIALVFVIATSAWYRMELYREEFGLTRLRVFTTAFMVWIALLLIWFALTVLTGRRERFAVGVLASGVAAVVILHAINPDALIVRTNLERAAQGERALDVRYIAGLSDDAAEVIFTDGRFPAQFAREFAMRRRTLGWRTWNASRAKAAALARAYESNATPPMRPVRPLGSTRESSSSRRFVISRNR